MSDNSRHNVRAMAWGRRGPGAGIEDVHYTEVGATGISTSSRRVLRNTYALLGMSLAFSAGVAGVAMTMHLPAPGLLLTLIGFYGLMFLVHKTANSGAGVLSLFALTGFMGYTLGPLLNAVLSMQNGTSVVASAMGSTALAFVGLSAVALTTKRDFSFMGKFLFMGLIGIMLAGLVNKELVAGVLSAGGRAIGISGIDGGLIEARIQAAQQPAIDADVIPDAAAQTPQPPVRRRHGLQPQIFHVEKFAGQPDAALRDVMCDNLAALRERYARRGIGTLVLSRAVADHVLVRPARQPLGEGRPA